MSEQNDAADSIIVACAFHHHYVRLAPECGWHRRWSEIPMRHRQLMIAASKAVIEELGLVPRPVEGASSDVTKIEVGSCSACPFAIYESNGDEWSCSHPDVFGTPLVAGAGENLPKRKAARCPDKPVLVQLGPETTESTPAELAPDEGPFLGHY